MLKTHFIFDQRKEVLYMQKILSYVRRCVEDYKMIEEEDRIAVGVSGGKDSLTLLEAMARLRDFYPVKFELQAITLDLGSGGMDFQPVADFCRELDVPYTLIPTQIKQIVFDWRKEKNPCSMCAKMRRGALNKAAVELGCNKVALGHHYDDAVETFLMSLIFEGRISCFQPVTVLDRTGITQIRPLLYVSEKKIKGYVESAALPVVVNTCPADKNTRREEVKTLIKDLSHSYPDIKTKVFGAMQRYPLAYWGVESSQQPVGGQQEADTREA